ncbi:DUF2971 domain-containing protein (plasmid) [Gordonia rubripertincta]|uniref:DUF2971 domain-containing protein n=1 Tax=Gordonia rubripertincta TaxID=36822 RepID=A0AAW6RED1_GORRU|nr:DUF2971 domain-containing protein [Gordonia rubripertincta]MDG6783137.1 DUF2971 domain-containing protein [Gordonia rubripertincta]NKY65452.1 DUF2971 domain-containing protein [Gordonia rubripertincta]
MTNDAAAPDLPPVLYHYTDAAGLQGILGPGRGPGSTVFPDEETRYVYRDDLNLYTHGKAALFRATDLRYMNDSLELSFGARIVRDRLREAAGEEGIEPLLASAFTQVADDFDPESLFDWSFRCFAVCFCGDGDLLSQWRGYAGGSGGFSIGFPRHILESHSYGVFAKMAHHTFDVPVSADLVQVVYGRSDAEARADLLVDSLKEKFATGALVPDLDDRPVFAAGMAAFRAIAGMKHEAFAEEREWRLVTVMLSNQQVRTRARASGVVPYLDVVVNSRLSGDHGPLNVSDSPLHEVVVGPSENPAAQVAGVRDLLASRGVQGFRAPGLREVPVVLSAAPFRS